MRYVAVGGKSISPWIGPCITAASVILEVPESDDHARPPVARLWNGARLSFESPYKRFTSEVGDVQYRVMFGAAPDEVQVHASNWATADTVAECVTAIDPTFFADAGICATVAVLDRHDGHSFVLVGDADSVRRQAELVDESR